MKINQPLRDKETSAYIFSKKKKRQYFVKLIEKSITNNRKFWQTVKPFLSDEMEVVNTLNIFVRAQ